MRRNKFQCLIAVLLTLISIKTVNAQSDAENASHQKAYFGFGLGIDYGGFGMRAQFLPAKNIGVFGGFGYNLIDIGYNAGLIIKPLPGKKIQPVLLAMYGYNAALKVNYGFGASFAKSYYGFSAGAGCEIVNNKNHIWSLELLVPFRNSEFHEEYNSLKNSGVEFNPGILPITFTVGYNFAVKPPKQK